MDEKKAVFSSNLRDLGFVDSDLRLFSLGCSSSIKSFYDNLIRESDLSYCYFII